MDTSATIEAKELDQWIAGLKECKQLEENQVKVLCEKVTTLVCVLHEHLKKLIKM